MFKAVSPLLMVFVSTAENAMTPHIFYFYKDELAPLRVSRRLITTEVSEKSSSKPNRSISSIWRFSEAAHYFSFQELSLPLIHYIIVGRIVLVLAQFINS